MKRSLNCLVDMMSAVLMPYISAAQDYHYYEVFRPDCKTDPLTELRDINDFGQAVGYYQDTECDVVFAVLWSNGIFVELDATYDDGRFAYGQGIANSGVIVGGGTPDDVLAVIDGVAIPQPIPNKCQELYSVEGMNDAGTFAVGECDDTGSGQFITAIYRLTDGVSFALPLLPGTPPHDSDGYGQAVNDDGVVVGIVQNFDMPDRAFWWKDGVMTEVFNGIGGVSVNFQAINNRGLIVGGADDDSGVSAAMSYDLNTGVMTDLGGAGSAHGVNDRGVAVGDDDVGFSSHAALYEDGELIDLHELVLSDYFSNTWANAINNYGWVVGWGYTLDDASAGWLLVPIYPKGDYDGDDDVDLHDFGHFQECFAAEPYQGPEGGLHVGCSVFDFDDDVDLDGDDFAAFQAAFTGAITSGW